MSLNPSAEVAKQATQQWGKPLYLHSLLSYHEIEFMVFAKNCWLRKNYHLVLDSVISFWYFFFIPLILQSSLLHFHYCSVDATLISEENNPSVAWLKD